METPRPASNHLTRRLTWAEANTFGKRLKFFRDRAGLSTYKLGALIGVSHNNITQTELGRHMPNVPRILSYCKALGIKPADLFPEGWTTPERRAYARKIPEQPNKGTGQGYEDSLC